MLPAVPPWLERFTKSESILSSIRNVNETHRLLTAKAGSTQNSRVIFNSSLIPGFHHPRLAKNKCVKNLLSLSSSNFIMNSIVKKLYAKKVFKVKESFKFPLPLSHLILFQSHPLHNPEDDPNRHCPANRAVHRQAF